MQTAQSQRLAGRYGWRFIRTWLLVLLATAATATALAREAPTAATGVPGVQAGQLDPDFWTTHMEDASRRVMEASEIQDLNARLFTEDGSMHDLGALPASMSGEQVLAQVNGLSSPPQRVLYIADGEVFDTGGLMDSLALDRVPERVTLRHGLVTHRADMRSFPTDTRVFSTLDDTDIDRFQETALFPGTPLAILHESRDGEWWFAISPRYAAWIRKSRVAIGERDTVLGYANRTPYLVVTGATVHTVHNPEVAQVSELQLDMGVRVPLLADWPGDRPVHGQAPYTAHVIELPIRKSDGSLDFTPALLPRTADVSADYLPMTRANIVRQGFKFLGERYGWGHGYNARDCSGFVSEVYRSFGVQLPRNTSAQGVSPVYDTVRFGESDDRQARLKVLRSLQPGDLIYIPGHVMMVIGQYEGAPYVIHDVTGISVRDEAGSLRRITLNAVSVTPLEPLQSGEDATLVDRIYSIQRVRPRGDLGQ